MAEAGIGLRIARHAQPGGQARARADQEQPLAAGQGVQDQGAGGLLAHQHCVPGHDLLQPRGQGTVGDLDREELQLLGPAGAGDGIGAQHRLAAVFARQADHHELARTEAEVLGPFHAEAEQAVGPVADPQNLQFVERAGFDGSGGEGGVGHRTPL